jgi:hypothetical protein
MRKLLAMLSVPAAMAIFTLPASAELGSDVPSDDQLLTHRIQEAGTSGSGVFDIAPPPDGQTFSPVNRVPRDRFGVVGPFPLQLQDLDALVYPDATPTERQALLEGLTFFTSSHAAAEGLGPINNQPFCLGCHENSAEAVRSRGLLGPKCPNGSTCVSKCHARGAFDTHQFRVHLARPRDRRGCCARQSRCPQQYREDSGFHEL